MTTVVDYRPPRIAQALVLAAVALNWLTPMHNWLLWQNGWVGTVLGVCGCVVMIAAWCQFRMDGVAICPTAHSSRLITYGIYGVTRNPMYLGMSAMLLGLAAVVGTLPFYLCALVFFSIMHWRFCPFEETKLTQAFGSGFIDYARRVRRWL